MKDAIAKILSFLEKTGGGSPFVLSNKRFVAESLELDVETVTRAIEAGARQGVLFYDDASQCFALPGAFREMLACFRDAQVRRKVCMAFYKAMRHSLPGEIVILLKNGKEHRLPQWHVLEWMGLFPEIDVVMEIMRYQNMTRHVPSRRPITPAQAYEAIFFRLERASERHAMEANRAGRLPAGAEVAEREMAQVAVLSSALRAFPELSAPRPASEEARQRQRMRFRKMLNQ